MLPHLTRAIILFFFSLFSRQDGAEEEGGEEGEGGGTEGGTDAGESTNGETAEGAVEGAAAAPEEGKVRACLFLPACLPACLRFISTPSSFRIPCPPSELSRGDLFEASLNLPSPPF